MKKYVVYCHTAPSGKKYVGCTSTELEKRFRQGRGYSNNTRFWADICTYGWDNFEHEVLYSDLTENEALEIECQLINEWNLLDPEFGYNLRDLEAGFSDASRQAMSDARRGNNNCHGRVLSEETKKKISDSLVDYYSTHDNPFKGRHHTQETIEKLRKRTISEETRRKLRDSHVSLFGKNNPSARPILQFTKDGEFVKSYEYASLAANELGADLSSIIKCCRGKIKSFHGFVWKYAE